MFVGKAYVKRMYIMKMYESLDPILRMENELWSYLTYILFALGKDRS